MDKFDLLALDRKDWQHFIAYIKDQWHNILVDEDHMPSMHFEWSLQGRIRRHQFCYEMLNDLYPLHASQ